jgi:ribosomal protein S18 acetylase RimI-like enzyme
MNNLDTAFGVHFRYAGALDIPYIFSLMTDTALNDGGFADTLLTGGGYGSLLIMLMTALHVFQRFKSRNKVRHDLWVVEADDEQVGFLHCIRGQTPNSTPTVHIQACAIDPAHRNRGYGKQMVAWLMAREAGSETVITASCNRYAKAMQHIFKRHRFVRESIGRGLERYVRQPGKTPASGEPRPAR